MNKKDNKMRVNQAIRARSIRLIGSEGEQVGVMDIEEAKKLATEAGLDLVEISPTAEPPVCRIMNYGKFKFQQSKKLKDARQKQKVIHLKEVKFKPRIDEHDFLTKVRHIVKFLNHGDKVRAFVHFRGRELVHKELGLRILERIIEQLGELVVVEKRPTMEGNQMAMMLIGREQASKIKPS